MNPAIQFGWDCDGLVATVRSEATPGWPPTGHWDERAPWKARYCAHKARVLGLLSVPGPEPAFAMASVTRDGADRRSREAK